MGTDLSVQVRSSELVEIVLKRTAYAATDRDVSLQMVNLMMGDETVLETSLVITSQVNGQPRNVRRCRKSS